MDVNENIALVVIGSKNQTLVDTRQIKDNIETLLQLWHKYKYTIIHVTLERDFNTKLQSIVLKDNEITLEQNEIREQLSQTILKNPFSRMVFVGLIDDLNINEVLFFAQEKQILLYQVNDAIAFQKENKNEFKNVSTKQILTLFKSIKD